MANAAGRRITLNTLSRVSTFRHASTSSTSSPIQDPIPALRTLLQTTDRTSFLLSHSFASSNHHLPYLAIRALNAELATIRDNVSNELLGRIRMGWWRDAVRSVYGAVEHGKSLSGGLQGQPVCQALYLALNDPVLRDTPSQGLLHSEHHFQALISAREDDLASSSSSSSSFTTLDELERYAERTASRLAYLELDLLGIRDPAMDEVCSHIGKARGLTIALASIPFYAKMQPQPTPTTTPSSSIRRLNLPQEYLLQHGVVEEEVYRKGPEAHGLRDAVFDTATRANDYLISARSALSRAFSTRRRPKVLTPVLMGAIPAKVYLEALERVQFDPFEPKLGQEMAGWRLSWALWKASWQGGSF